MKGRGQITLPTHRVDVTENGTGIRDDLVLDASFFDYGRNDRPTLTASLGEELLFSFEFATPDDARKLGERLFDLARKSEEKTGQRGPEYRAKLARDEALAGVRDVVERLEKAMGVEIPNEGVHVMSATFNDAALRIVPRA